MRPPIGTIGDADDNAMAERFFAPLVYELIDRRSWQTKDRGSTGAWPTSSVVTTRAAATAHSYTWVQRVRHADPVPKVISRCVSEARQPWRAIPAPRARARTELFVDSRRRRFCDKSPPQAGFRRALLARR